MSKSKLLEDTIIADILASHTAEICRIVETLRSLIHKAVPQAREKAQPRWHSLNFSHPEAGYFCGIFPFQNEVKLIFEFGVLLADLEGLLQGNAKQIRYVLLRNQEDINTHRIQKLIEAALELPHSRATKLALIQSKAKPIGGN